MAQSEKKRKTVAAEARAMATKRRRHLRRAKSEAHLAEIMPAELQMGWSYHVISGGDIDSLSFLGLLMRQTSFDHLILSTWVLAMDDVCQLRAWMEAGKLGQVDAYVGEIFPNQYGDEFEAMRVLCSDSGGRLAVFRNHSKVMTGLNGETGFSATIESSANLNTNPRTEQTAIHCDEDLYWFYRDFYDGIRSIHRPG